MNNCEVKKGQKVYSGLYGGRSGIIFGISGQQDPGSIKSLGGGCVVMGGSADFDIVFDNGTISKCIPESIIRGIQWEIYPEIATEEEIKTALAHAEVTKIAKEESQQIEKEDFSNESANLPEQYPYLETLEHYGTRTGKKFGDRVLGANNIRKELKRLWPEIKFSVRGESFSGGDAIDISWTDGPTEKQVNKITGKYVQGGFDSMTDCSYSVTTPFNTVFGGAKYIHGQRKESPERTIKAGVALGHIITPGMFDQWGSLEGPNCPLDRETRRAIHSEARKI